MLHLVERSNPLLHVITLLVLRYYAQNSSLIGPGPAHRQQLCAVQKPAWRQGDAYTAPETSPPMAVLAAISPGPRGPEVTSPEHMQLAQWIWKPASTALGAGPASLMSWTAFSVGGLLGALH